MWIIPKNYKLASLFVRDMVDSKEEFIKQLENYEHSLMWRSKPTRLRTWLARWSKIYWIAPLSGRMLKHSAQNHFEDALTLLLEDIRASRFRSPEIEKERATKDIYGHTLKELCRNVCQDKFFSRMLRDISLVGSYKSSQIWRKWVTELRLDYSRRKKLALLIKEKECLYSANWSTPTVMDCADIQAPRKVNKSGGQKPPLCQMVMWPTPTVCMIKGSSGKITMKDGRVRNNRLDYATEQFGQQDKDKCSMNGSTLALNPEWVEQLMGIPHGLTNLDYLETE